MADPVRVITVTLNPAIDWTVNVAGFTAGTVNRTQAEQQDAGGKGINVAALLGAAGVATGVTGFLGTDNDRLFNRLFERMNLHDRCVRVPGHTRTNMKVVDSLSGAVTDINAPGFSITAEQLQALEHELKYGPLADWYLLAGSLPQGVPTDIYQRWVELLHARGAKVAVDASGEALIAAVQAKPDLIKPNEHELAQLTGAATDSADACLAQAKALVAQGVGQVVVSRGSAGALFVRAEQTVVAQPGPVKLKTTVGAGDAMVAGLLVGLVHGQTLEEQARLATAYAMSAVETVGPYRPSDEELNRYATSVTVEAVVAP